MRESLKVTKQLRSFVVLAAIVACGGGSVDIVSAKGGPAAYYPWPEPCAYSGYADVKCPGFREALASPTCRSILAKLSEVDRTDWRHRRTLVDAAKRIGCVARPK
jgi:hypothetical protein